MTFDPKAALPGAPDPWASSTMPALRDGPPYAMTEMIAAEPALAERLLTALRDDAAVMRLADELRATAAAGEPVTFAGCGTSEHAAIAAAAIVGEAILGNGGSATRQDRVRSAQAFELLGRPHAGGLVIGVSHEGGTWATNQSMGAARKGGSRTALISVSDRSPGARLAEVVIQTREQDQSWCHTIGYLSPILAAAAVAAALRGEPADPIAARALLDSADDPETAEAVAGVLAACERLVVVGTGADYAAACELALKVEEGAHMPATAYQLETLLHGHLAAADARSGLVLLLTDPEGRGPAVVERARTVLRAASALGMPAAAILAADLGDDVPADLTPAGRLMAPLSGRMPRVESALIGSAIPLQLLAERLARARGTNPDAIGRDDPRQAAAANA